MMKHSLGYSKGLSLVELMVAMTVGLLLVLAISIIFVRSSAMGKNQGQNVEMAENARFALAEIGRVVRQQAFNAETHPLTVSASDSYSDVLSVSYDPNETASAPFAMQDCAGKNIDPDLGVAVIRLSVQGDNTKRQLTCETEQNGVKTAVPIADNVEAMRVLVGHSRGDCSGDAANSASATVAIYRPAGAIAPAAPSVPVALRVGLILRSPQIIPAADRTAQSTFPLLGAVVSSAVSLDISDLTADADYDQGDYLHKIFNTTYYLRNGCAQ